MLKCVGQAAVVVCFSVTLRRMKYLGSIFTITIDTRKVDIVVHDTSASHPLVLRYNDTQDGRRESIRRGTLSTLQ